MTEQENPTTVEDPAEVEDYPLYGVSLRQYAAIQAALAEGFTEEEVLQKERVLVHDWRRAERKWLLRFDEQKSLAERLATEMAAAEDWLWRDIVPVQDDARAWAALYAAYSAASNRNKWLAQQGLTQNDISRLVRHWSRRAATDTTLAQRLTQCPQNADAPDITPSPKKLKRARKGGASAVEQPLVIVTPQQEAKPEPPALDDLDVFVFGIDRYAALCAELEVFPKEAERIRNKYKLATEADHQILIQRMREHLSAHADHERDYRRQYQLAQARAKKLAETTTAEERAEANRKRSESEELKPSFAEQINLSTSVVEMPSAPAIAPVIAEIPSAAPAASSHGSGATQDVSALFAAISEPALPFAAPDPKETPDEIVARIEAVAPTTDDQDDARPEPGGTRDIESILAKAELPANWMTSSPTPTNSAAATAAKPVVLTSTNTPADKPDTSGTRDVADILAKAALPDTWTNPSTVRSEVAAPAVKPTEEKPVVKPDAGGTRDVEAILAKTELPSNWTNPSSTPAVAAPVAPPTAEKPVVKPIEPVPQQRPSPTRPPTPVAALPELTVEQYAYLCVELEARPDRTGETLGRYRVVPEAIDTVHAVWRQRLAHDRTASDVFARVCADYRAWLSGQNRQVPQFTLEQYASLLVDVSMAPAQRLGILQRYGLDDASKALLDQSFQQRMHADPRLRAALDHAMATYRAWLARGGK